MIVLPVTAACHGLADLKGTSSGRVVQGPEAPTPGLARPRSRARRGAAAAKDHASHASRAALGLRGSDHDVSQPQIA